MAYGGQHYKYRIHSKIILCCRKVVFIAGVLYMMLANFHQVRDGDSDDDEKDDKLHTKFDLCASLPNYTVLKE